jgi:hypothetical protein
VSTINFDLSDSEKDYLVAAGRAAALRFLNRQGFEDGPTDDDVTLAVQEADALRQAAQEIWSKRWRVRCAIWGSAAAVILLGVFSLASWLFHLLWQRFINLINFFWSFFTGP